MVTTYYYAFFALNSPAESANSAEVNATPVAPAPVLLSLTPQTNGQFTFQFQGIDNENYIVEESSKLMDWVAIFTNAPVSGVFIFSDTNVSDTSRFYRVLNERVSNLSAVR